MAKIVTLAKTGGQIPCRPRSSVIRTAQDAARSYDHCIEAYWRGEDDGCAFRSAFATYWRPTVARAEDSPGIVSPLGAGGRGLVWREANGTVVGAVQGGAGGYQIPVGALLPDPRSPSPLIPRAELATPSLRSGC